MVALTSITSSLTQVIVYDNNTDRFSVESLNDEELEKNTNVLDFNNEDLYSIVFSKIDELVEYLNLKKFKLVGGYSCLGTACLSVAEESVEEQILAKFA